MGRRAELAGPDDSVRRQQARLHDRVSAAVGAPGRARHRPAPGSDDDRARAAERARFADPSGLKPYQRPDCPPDAFCFGTDMPYLPPPAIPAPRDPCAPTILSLSVTLGLPPGCGGSSGGEIGGGDPTDPPAPPNPPVPPTPPPPPVPPPPGPPPAPPAQKAQPKSCPSYGDRYIQHLNTYLIDPGKLASLLGIGLWPKSWAPATAGRGPLLGSPNPLTSVPRAIGLPEAGSTAVRFRVPVPAGCPGG